MKPHEETLDVEGVGPGKYIVHARSVFDPPDCSRLIGQAPAMARLLLAQASDPENGCWRCGAVHGTEDHDADCALIAVLRAAGVIE